VKASVVIPTYLRQKDLAELFESILNQTCMPLEVIVVDDSPTDEINKLCTEYGTKFAEKGVHLFYIKNDRERSAAIARNIGVENSKGDIVLFLDSDVVLEKNFIEEVLRVFKERPDAIGVAGYITNIRIERGLKGALRNLFGLVFRTHYRYPADRCRLLEYPGTLTRVIECEWLSGSASAYRRDIFKEFKFDENLKGYSYMEDVLFSHLIFKKHPKSLLMTPNARYVHKVSPKDYEENIKRHKNMCRKYVLVKLYGIKGLLLYYWQNIGYTLITLLNMKNLYKTKD